MGTSNPATLLDSSRKIASPAKRQRWSPELKRQIVQETMAPGASVARVARAHGVNANQVFAWRRQYQQGLLEASDRITAGLLAVRVAEPERSRRRAEPTGGRGLTETRRTPSGTIQVELPKGRLRLTGPVDPETLRVVLEALRG